MGRHDMEKDPLRRVLQLATGAIRALQTGGATTGRTALEKIRIEVQDAIDREPDIDQARAELVALCIEAIGLADGEAVDAYSLLIDAVENYLRRAHGVEVPRGSHAI